MQIFLNEETPLSKDPPTEIFQINLDQFALAVLKHYSNNLLFFILTNLPPHLLILYIILSILVHNSCCKM